MPPDQEPAVVTPVVEPVVEPAAAAVAEPAPAATAAPEVIPAASGPATPDWVPPRLNKLTSERDAAREELVRIKAENEALKAAGQTSVVAAPAATVAAPAAYDPAEIERQANIIANRRAAEINFTNTCNGIAEKGIAKHTDFQQTVGQIGLVGGLSPELINAAMEVGDAHEVLYALGKNLDKAAAILAMPPAQMGVALAKLAAAGKPLGKAVSDAPAPIGEVVGGSSPAGELDARMSSDDWFAKREKQKLARMTA